MLKCEDLKKIFDENDLTFFSGVPDSTFKGWMNYLAEGNGMKNIIACNECEAVANCSGYHLATGKVGVVYMQNSGLGKTVNPITSLVDKEIYSIPMVLMIGWRGNPNDEKEDEPQHKMMGKIMFPLLNILDIPYKIIPEDKVEAAIVIEKMKKIAEETKHPVAIIIQKGIIDNYNWGENKEEKYEMLREDAIKTIIDNLDGDEVIVSTTGHASRELFEYRVAKEEKHRDFYTVGSMGCSASIGNIIALEKPDKKIFVFDGDGAVLMQKGALASIGNYGANNFYHIIFDNHSYDSTGGQPSVSESINFEKIAEGCGYNFIKKAKTKLELLDSIKELKEKQGPCMLIVNINKGSRKNLGRPTTTPIENKEAFMEFLNK
ncbi:MAG: phosphonopyruvate decarboxylase [Nanoarchaeota archaeon]|nr:phosphonopyruvate decarboxylase [Nanoarchaeota archaeon]